MLTRFKNYFLGSPVLSASFLTYSILTNKWQFLNKNIYNLFSYFKQYSFVEDQRQNHNMTQITMHWQITQINMQVDQQTEYENLGGIYIGVVSTGY
jgi:hypothetical protein